jgi:hypothetical protein
MLVTLSIDGTMLLMMTHPLMLEQPSCPGHGASHDRKTMRISVKIRATHEIMASWANKFAPLIE